MRTAVWVLGRLAGIFAQSMVISFLAFILLYLAPGSPESILLGSNAPTPETLAAIRQRFNLDDSLWMQYVNWLQAAVQFDFGQSIQTGEAVSSMIGSRLPTTLALAAFAGTIVVLIGIPLGLVAGAHEGRGVDRTISAGSALALSAPSFATGILLIYVFAVAVPWFPVAGAGEGFVGMLWHLTLPAIALALSVVAIVIRQTRAMAAGVVRSDFVLFARARAVPESILWRRYLLRNSALPLATSVGLIGGFFLTGSVIVEQAFSLNGLGSLIVTSIEAKDIPVVQAVTLLAGLIVLLANFAADVSHMLIDPRVRLGSTR